MTDATPLLPPDATSAEHERRRRWRLALGRAAEPPDEQGGGRAPLLDQHDRAMDQALEALYESERSGGLGNSCPSVPRWLGDIRRYFPTPVVQILQHDALSRLKLKELLLEPELLSQIVPDVHLVATLVSMKSLIPSRTMDTARHIVRKLAEELTAKLRLPLEQALRGARDRRRRTTRPRLADIDWNRTIRANLKHYEPSLQTIVPQTVIGNSRRDRRLHEFIICVDQSGSMAGSVVHASIVASLLASLPAIKTSLVCFDTQVVDRTPELTDPVEVLFSCQLGGGTDIGLALGYCRSLVTSPERTTLVLISDLYEGPSPKQMLREVAALLLAGVQLVCFLALDDTGHAASNQTLAQKLGELGVPVFTCTPTLFPEFMAAVLNGEDLHLWAAQEGLGG